MLATLVLLAAPLCSRVALATATPRLAVLLLTTLQLAGLACLLAERRSSGGPARTWLWLLPAIGLWLAARHVPPSTALLADAALAHATIQGALLLLFARSLRPGHEPLVTMIARRVHGTLRPDIVAYTRHATIAWCVFFLSELLLSAALLAWAPVRWWWRLVPDLCLPLTIAMFVAEYLHRRWTITAFEHASFSAAIAAFRGRARPDAGVR